MKLRKKIIALLTVFLVICAVVPVSVSGANQTVTECVNLVNVQKNERGPGWNWANRYDIMTFSNLRIETSDDYGVRLPADATVVLEGDNYIKAGKAGIVCAGTTTFKGEGTLTIVSGDTGIFVNCSNERKTVSIVGGTYTIESANECIRSLRVPFSIADCKMTLRSAVTAAAGNFYSISLNGAEIDTNGSFNAEYGVTVFDCALEINSTSPAFSTQKGSISWNKESLGEYSGESVLSVKGTAPHYTQSILFGAGVHIWVDYLVIGALVVLGGLAIFFRVYRQRKRDAERKARIEAIRARGGDIADLDEN